MLRVIVVAAIIAAGSGIITLAPATIAAAGKCDPGYYWSKTHGDCVERPDNNPSNATARCNDGVYSHSQTPGADENCSGHGGVAQMCPCAGANAGPSDSTGATWPATRVAPTADARRLWALIRAELSKMLSARWIQEQPEIR